MYIIFLVFRKKNVKEGFIFTLSFIALIVHLCLGEFSSLFGIKVPLVLVRNFLLMGFPFFGVGLYIKKNEKRFKQVSNLCLILTLMIGVILSLVSSYLFGQNELYVGSVVISISLMIIAIKNSEKTYSCFMNRLFECSTFIYLFHPLLHNLSQHICGKFQVDMSSMIVRNSLPILICLIVTFGVGSFKIDSTSKVYFVSN